MPQPTPPDLCSILPTPTKGLGVFALQPITPGKVLIHDKPILRLSRGTRDITVSQLTTALSHLSEADRTTFLSLHENNLPYQSRELRIYKSNCFGDAETSWLSLKFSRVNHSCVPNAEITRIDSPSGAEIVAIKKIARGEEVCICYLGPGEDGRREQRRELLRGTYGFACACHACGFVGREGWVSDARRGFIAVLAGRQMEMESGALRNDPDVNGSTRRDAGPLCRTLGPLAAPLTRQEKVQTNYLLACLLEAEGLRNYRLAQAWVHAAVALMGQMQDLKPLVVLPAAGFVVQWLERARVVMASVRETDSSDVRELGEACGILVGCGYMRAAREVMEKSAKKMGKKTGGNGTALKNSEVRKGGGKGKKARLKAIKKGAVKEEAAAAAAEELFATIFGQTDRFLTQSECIQEVRKTKGRRTKTWDVVIEGCDEWAGQS